MSDHSKVAKWGNSAAVRITTDALEVSHLRIDDPVDVVPSEGQIIIRRRLPEVTLDALLDRFDPTLHRHELLLDFDPVGTETGA
jgi:antitoxin component of MazEF toxin-antitoxin module